MRYRGLACLGIVISFAVATSRAIGQALIDRVPDDAIAYVGWKGGDALSPAYQQSKLKKFVDAAGIPAMIDQELPKIIQAMNGNDPTKADDVRLMSHFVKMMVRHPMAVYVAAPPASAVTDKSGMRIGLLCQAGDDKDVLLALFDKVVADHKNDDSHPRTFSDGDVIAIVMGYPEGGMPLAQDMADGKPHGGDGEGPKNSLGASAAFASSKSQLVADPAVVTYVNGAKWLAYLDEMAAAQGDEKMVSVWKAGRDAAGLGGFKGYVISAGFTGEGWTAQSFIDAPAPRTGLLKLLQPTPIDPVLLNKIPGDSISAAVGQFDLGALLATVRSVVAAMNPQAGDQFQKGIGFLSLTLGRRLDTEMLAPLGSQWAWYAQSAAGSTPSGVVIVNKLADAKLAGDSWDDVAFGLTNTLPTMLRRMGITAVPTQDDSAVPGASVFSVQINGSDWKPGWVVKDQFMYFGVDPAVMAAAAKAAPTAKITADAKFSQLLQALGSPAYTSFVYSDLAATGPGASKDFGALWDAARGKAKQQGVDLPETLLPSLEAAMPLLSPAMSVKWTDEKGFYSKERTPFPGAATVYGNSQSDELVFSSAVLSAGAVAKLTPITNQARESAMRTQSLSNLRQMGLAMRIYASHNDGKAPPDLGSLVNSGLQVDTFVVPSTGTTIPAEVRSGTPQQKTDWVNAHSDYVYIKPEGLMKDAEPDLPTAYEKIGVQGSEGINVLYGDGHCEWVKMAIAVDLIQQTSGAKPVTFDRAKETKAKP